MSCKRTKKSEKTIWKQLCDGKWWARDVGWWVFFGAVCIKCMMKEWCISFVVVQRSFIPLEESKIGLWNNSGGCCCCWSMFPFGKGWQGATWLLWCVSFSSRRRQMGRSWRTSQLIKSSVHIYPSQTVYSHNNSYILMSQEHSIHPSHWLWEADDLRMSTGSMSTFILFFFQKEKEPKPWEMVLNTL